jgi:hypothetical protein
MLHRFGLMVIEDLIDALKKDLPLYAGEGENCEVPYKDDDLNRVMMAKFVWLAEQWVYVDVREK